ncbi:UTR1 [Candida pseudojiufengensis]|uniref:UTR1 n=1 Tax=Candida pseudojiufengensis TaxID=497109 RepID=UPI002224A56C|nr:UTR1 [Candida pseudojiufengensis]KAI5961658.1 UTR1 [Candida pseudojiufengensis]
MTDYTQSQLTSQLKKLNTNDSNKSPKKNIEEDVFTKNGNQNFNLPPEIHPLTKIVSPSDPLDLQQIRQVNQNQNGLSHTSSSSSISSLATEIMNPQNLHPTISQQSQSNIVQPQPQHSSFRRKNSIHKFSRSQFSLGSSSTTPSSTTNLPNGSNSAANSNLHSICNSPKDIFVREPPRIHSKLYCDEVGINNKTAKEVLSRLSSDELRSVKTHTELAETANGVRMLAKNLSKATIQLDVKAMMIITKARDNSLIYLTREVVEWLFTKHPSVTVYVDEKLKDSKRFNSKGILEEFPTSSNNLKYWNKKLALKSPELFDLVVTLGGDGTVLYVSNLFQRIVPPVLSFALGSLGFLTNFKFDQYKERMNHCIDSGVKANLRMRFTCRVHNSEGKLICEQQVLNEVVVDRGPSPFVTQLELYGDGSLLTIAQADGLIIATPTGSTAYSLSAGGSLVHPGVSAISVTPICPHTLSFRPILLPDGMFLKIKVPSSSRSTAWCSFDGRVRTELKKDYYVTVQASPFPFPTVISSKTEYIDSVSRNLHWNIREQQKPFSSYLKPETRRMIVENDDTAKKDETDDEEEFDIDYSDQDIIEEKSNTSNDSNNTEELAFLPANGGTATPQTFHNQDDRCCYAHPHARVHLNGS